MDVIVPYQSQMNKSDLVLLQTSAAGLAHIRFCANYFKQSVFFIKSWYLNSKALE